MVYKGKQESLQPDILADQAVAGREPEAVLWCTRESRSFAQILIATLPQGHRELAQVHKQIGQIGHICFCITRILTCTEMSRDESAGHALMMCLIMPMLSYLVCSGSKASKHVARIQQEGLVYEGLPIGVSAVTPFKGGKIV
eukprot:scaffold232392_cov19-Tisochrysis_lutea.AAC.1